MKKFLVALCMVLALFTGVSSVTAENVSADIVQEYSECGNSGAFFSLRPWYYKLTTTANGRCEIGTPVEDKIPQFVWTIVLNIIYDISILIGYLTIIMVAWGGYLYMFSQGMPDRAEKGKKTLISAMTGLALSILASLIMNTIVTILTTTA